MAYRHFLALSCVILGLAAMACGGGKASPTEPPDSDALAAHAADQPVNDADQPIATTDRPPTNADQPPAGPTGGGGSDTGVETQCRQFCSGIVETSECAGDGANQIARNVCDSGCTLTAQTRPCAAKAAALIACLAGLDGLCTEDGPSDAAAQRCTSPSNELNDCIENGGATPPAGNCTKAGACQCGNTCELCRCLATDQSSCDDIC